MKTHTFRIRFNEMKLLNESFIFSPVTFQSSTKGGVFSDTSSSTEKVEVAFIIIAIAVALSVFLVVIYNVANYLLEKERLYSKYKHLPFHWAIIEGAMVTQEFFDANLPTANLRDADGNTVIDLILARMPTYKITPENWYTLLVQSLPFDPLTGNATDPDVHNYAWTNIVQHDYDVTVYVVQRITEEAGDRVDRLLYCVDRFNRMCIDIAAPICKDIMSRTMFLFGCYELREGNPEYETESTLIRIAVYHAPGTENIRNAHRPKVALKFMRDRWQYLKETELRYMFREHHSTDHVDGSFLPIMSAFDGDSDKKEDLSFRKDAIKRGFGAFPYCIAMNVADINLRAHCDMRRSAIVNWDEIKRIMKALLMAISKLHEEGIVHGDIKPSNIVFLGHKIYLIDLDAAVTFNEDCPQFVGAKFSSAYCPPEFIHQRFGSAVVKAYRGDQLDHSAALTSPKKYDYQYLKAHPSFDMWAVGCVLYYLCTGNTLFQTTVGDNTTSKELLVLANWNNTVKEEKLRNISNDYAANLLSLLLDTKWERRLDASHALAHPFITGLQPTRLPGTKPIFDIFISYRVATESDFAVALYEHLTAAGLNVWLDKVCLKPGQEWEEGFCEGLVNSACFVCLLSRLAINNSDPKKPNFSRLESSSACDNVLLEWRLALELKSRNMIAGIFPVLIGDKTALNGGEGSYSGYFKDHCHPQPLPDIQVDTIEQKLRFHLERHGLGIPFDRFATVSKTVGAIIANQGGFFEGDHDIAMKYVVEEIVTMRENKLLEAEVAEEQTTRKPSSRSLRLSVETMDSDNDSPGPSSVEKLSARLSSIRDEQASRRLSMSSNKLKTFRLPPREESPEKQQLQEKIMNLSDIISEQSDEIRRLRDRLNRYEAILSAGQLGQHVDASLHGNAQNGRGVPSLILSTVSANASKQPSYGELVSEDIDDFLNFNSVYREFSDEV